MNNPYPSIFILGSALLWFTAACSHDALAPVNPDGQSIHFTTNIGSVVKTSSRAANNTWTENDEVGIFMAESNYVVFAGANALHKADATNTTVTLVPAPGHELYYPLGGNDVRFIAYYPYNENITSIEYDYPIILGDQDNAPAFDLLWYKDTGDTGLFNKESGSPALLFTHQLSKIVLNFQYAEGVEDLTLDRVDLTNIPTAAGFDLVTGEISNLTQIANVAFSTTTLSEEDTDAGIMKRFEAIIIPHNGEMEAGVTEDGEAAASTAREIKISGTIVAGDWETSYDHVESKMSRPISADKAFERGKRHIYNFIVTPLGIEFLNTTIEDWDVETTNGVLESTLTLSETEYKMPGETDTHTVSLKTNNPSAPVATSSDESWLTVKSVATSSKGRYDLIYECMDNDTGKSRQATITITAGAMEKVYTVTQRTIATTVASANSIVVVTNGAPVRIPVAFLNEVGNYPGITDGGETYTSPFTDENNVAFETKVLWIDSPNFADASLKTTTPTDIIADVWEECATLNSSYLVVEPGTHPGNAVVCITKPGTNDIIWSWHIWVTTPEDREIMWIKDSADNSIGKPEPTANGYAFFPVNVGAFQKEGESGVTNLLCMGCIINGDGKILSRTQNSLQ